MTDPLVRRMSGRERASARDRLAMDADRLAAQIRRYADDLKEGKTVTGGESYQIAQGAIDLLRQASFLAGMDNIGQLIE